MTILQHRLSVIRCLRIPAFAICLSFIACEKVDISELTDNNQTVPSSPATPPLAVGRGTQEVPYTVDQVLNNELPAESCWVIGYVVGSTYRTMSGASFDKEAGYTSNILLSSDSTCCSKERCIPIELPTAAIQHAIGLPHNQPYHRQCAMIQGTPNLYFSTRGIRKTSSAYWLPHFDISTIAPPPIPWDEVEREY